MTSSNRHESSELWLDTGPGYVAKSIEEQLSVSSLALPPTPGENRRNRTYAANEDFWSDLISEQIRSGAVVKLENFNVFEWFPRSPGLFHTAEGCYSRENARLNLYTLDPVQEAEYIRSRPVNNRIYNLHGKAEMLSGGVGCIRLRDKITDFGRTWFMAASSTLVAHEGIPIGLTDDMYQTYIDDIATHGALSCSLVGRLKFLPDSLLSLYSHYSGVPKFYLMAEEMRPLPSHWASMPVASGAVTFMKEDDANATDYRNFRHEPIAQFFAAYIDFVPGWRGTLDSRLGWLERYVHELHEGTVVTDFDEQTTRFANATFSLDRVLNHRIQRDSVERLVINMDYSHNEVHVDRLFARQLELREITMGDRFENIGAGAVIVNRSTLDNALNAVSSGAGSEATQALREIARFVEESGNEDAAENLNGITEELQRTEPRKARLRAFWQGLTTALPDVAQVGDSVAKITSLFG